MATIRGEETKNVALASFSTLPGGTQSANDLVHHVMSDTTVHMRIAANNAISDSLGAYCTVYAMVILAVNMYASQPEAIANGSFKGWYINRKVWPVNS